MTDPVSIGTLAASAMGMAAEAALKGLTGEAAKDAYKALRTRIGKWVNNDVEALERDPSSKGRQAVIAEVLDRQAADDLEDVKRLTKMLIGTLTAARNIGLNVGILEALEVQIGNITVSNGIGAQISTANIHGTFNVGDIVVDDPPGKYKR